MAGQGAAGCSWRVDPDGRVGAGNVGGGLVVRGEAAGVVAVVVAEPFIAAGRNEGDWKRECWCGGGARFCVM